MEIMEIYNKLITERKCYFRISLSGEIIEDNLNCYDHICVDLENKSFVFCKKIWSLGDEDTCYDWKSRSLESYGTYWALTKEELVRKVRRND